MVKWASALHHALKVVKSPLPPRNRRKCRCGCGKKETHLIMANGISLGGGCELDAHRFKKKFDKLKQGKKQ